MRSRQEYYNRGSKFTKEELREKQRAYNKRTNYASQKSGI